MPPPALLSPGHAVRLSSGERGAGGQPHPISTYMYAEIECRVGRQLGGYVKRVQKTGHPRFCLLDLTGRPGVFTATPGTYWLCRKAGG